MARGVLTRVPRCVAMLLAIVLWLSSGAARADCSYDSGYTPTNVTLPLISTLNVARNAQPSTVIYDSGWIGFVATKVTCNGTSNFAYGYASAMTPVTGMSHVYDTGVPGIGIKIGYSNALSGQSSNIDTITAYNWLLDWPRNTTSYTGYYVYTPAAVYRVQFIVTGPLQAGSFAAKIPSPTASTTYGSLTTTQVSFTSTTINIQSRGCQVTNSNIVVQLPDAQVRELKGIGTTVGATAFQIPLVCDSGVKIAYEIDGTSGSSADGVLANQTGSGFATGVGVQLVQNATPVKLNTLSGTYITTTSDKQTVNIPFTAQYFQTAASPAAGSVQATATFQMNYQ